MTIPPHNISLIALDKSEKKAGKVAPYNGRLVYHVWFQQWWKRRDIDAYGISEPIFTYCQELGVRDYYLYDKEASCTYGTDDERLLLLGTTTNGGKQGKQINLPTRYWDRIEGRLPLPFIPPEVAVRVPVLAELVVETRPTPEPKPDPQLSLFGGTND